MGREMNEFGKEYVVTLSGTAANCIPVCRTARIVHHYVDAQGNLVLVRYDGILVSFAKGTWIQVDPI